LAASAASLFPSSLVVVLNQWFRQLATYFFLRAQKEVGKKKDTCTTQEHG
jgi:hypothetical protein